MTEETADASGERDPDPRGLLAEAYAMGGLSREDCRSILLDWALGRSPAEGTPEALHALHARYAPRFPAHPMTAVLAEGLSAPPVARRRGGRGR